MDKLALPEEGSTCTLLEDIFWGNPDPLGAPADIAAGALVLGGFDEGPLLDVPLEEDVLDDEVLVELDVEFELEAEVELVLDEELVVLEEAAGDGLLDEGPI